MARTPLIPLDGTETQREACVSRGLLTDPELNVTTDQHRLFVGDFVIAPVWHGSVTLAEMLDLFNTEERGCFSGDWCFCTDTNTLYLCIARFGLDIADWWAVLTLSTDGTMGGGTGGPSDLITPSQKAVRTFVLGTIAAIIATDTGLGGLTPSDILVPSQKAVKTYADNLLTANEAMIFKGVIDCSANPNYPAASIGWTWKVSVAGKIGGASGVEVEMGDTVMCTTANAGGTQAAVGSDFVTIQTNIAGAVIGPTSSVDQSLVIFSGTTGRLVADSGVLVSAISTCLSNYATGPGSSVANHLAAFSGTDGRTLIDSGILISTLVVQGVITGCGLTMGSGYLLGRYSAATGAIQLIQIGANLQLSAGGFLSAGGGQLSGIDMREVWALY